MKDIFKSKAMIGFLIFMVGFFYMNAIDVKKLDETKTTDNMNYVAMNV